MEEFVRACLRGSGLSRIAAVREMRRVTLTLPNYRLLLRSLNKSFHQIELSCWARIEIYVRFLVSWILFVVVFF